MNEVKESEKCTSIESVISALINKSTSVTAVLLQVWMNEVQVM
jgi:hypothetical protein